ncbi:MAG: class I SAM-dependent methyltransferase [Alphaproteobacteria bacterium]|nr:class I SAM-dependent methyltransferase [Alphaproteobacteria bacterium]
MNTCERCELCQQAALEPIYRGAGTVRDLTIHLCRHCGLLQSLPRIDQAPRRAAAASGAADWGNIRYGKGFRTAHALGALSRHADLSAPAQVLDVGSNRGSFARQFMAAAPNASLLAIEPDARVADCVQELDRTELICARIEDVALQSERFDIVHSCHTIEHVASPAKVLADHWRVLKPQGLLVLDAPSTAILESEDMVEEWFIDKHLYHFSARTLMRMVSAAGFEIIEPPEPGDRENLLLVAVKSGRPTASTTADPREVSDAERRVATYGRNRAANLAALTAVATEIAHLSTRRVVIWGAGRLFDALITFGGFAPSLLAGLIDAHLGAHLPQRHGLKVHPPEAITAIAPDVVVVMSRTFAGEIADTVRRLAPNAEIITYGELIGRARLAVAA